MSSLYGLWQWPRRPGLARDAALMATALSRYGPDRQFGKVDGAIAFGGNLSAFLPEDCFDRQPVPTQDGQSWLIADLRLDNRAELGISLGLTQPESLADSTLLAHAWARWGTATMDRLRGVFAFAVWTPARQELLLVRDQVGERPMFYHAGPDFFAFASMPKGLLALPGVARGVDEDTLIRALTLAAYPQDASFFAGIDRLPPGHMLRVFPGQVERTAYWRPFEARIPHFRRDEDYVEAFLEIFDSAVQAQLRSTGGIATQLSSGLDSSSVTTSAARLLAREGKRLTSFTAVPRPGFLGKGWPGRLPDEGPGARKIAQLYPNLDHVLLDSSGQDMVQVVQKLSDAADEPIQNGVNALWIAATLDAARAGGANVLLVGFRGNLTLSHTGLEAMGELFRQGRWLRLARAASSMRAKGMVSYKTSLRRALTGILPDALHRRLQNSATFDLTYSAVNTALATRLHLKERMLAEWFSNRHDLRAERLQLLRTYDLDTYAAGYQAVHGIDVRDPCADRRVLEFCFGLPISQYIVGDQPRSLVRRAMQGRLPQSTLTRTVRGQQGADWYLAVREALPGLREQMSLNAQSPTVQRLIDVARIDALLNTWPDRPLEDQNVSHAWGDALCRGFSFGYFIRRHDHPAERG